MNLVSRNKGLVSFVVGVINGSFGLSFVLVHFIEVLKPFRDMVRDVCEKASKSFGRNGGIGAAGIGAGFVDT